MRRLLHHAAVVLALATPVAAAPEQSDTPDRYAVRAPVTVAAGSAVQRLTLPAAVIAASRTGGLNDVRVFDADHRAMPIARATPADAPGRRVSLRVMPILGSGDTLDVTGVSLRIDDSGRASVAQVEGKPGDRVATATLGVLLDARRIVTRAAGLSLDATLPAGQPVTFVVDASDDLKTWRTLGDKTVYRAGDARDAVAIPLGGARLNGDYLRVSWRGSSRLLSPVGVEGAALLTQADAAASVTVAATLPPLTDAHAIEFVAPFASPFATVRVLPTGNDMIVPIRILGRDNREQPWTALGEGTATRADLATSERGAIMVGDSRHRLWRIEADEGSPGFTAPPTLELGFAPAAVVFLAAGRPPYTLAVGRAGTADPYLPLASLRTTTPATAPVTLPATTLHLAAADDSGRWRRQALLWAVLLAATALLAAMAWMLWRRTGRDAPVSGS
ncbi:DUF3999 family protein [Microvirga sp. SRT01]|uniref:DUF3999 family protein n=1 Tax=Sphingomonas longa TaxID=2778730 RepID=A0ABS2D507_9SPHN|nr:MULTISPECIES: DUF3999 family protein [Alphaproteobacteria]MBM6575996.1 DUF3999 family protein [Sphingomonas sp. BT552]MBR7709042.1 DUF3999 family protein [Microvirga sp. SRT01]